MKKYLAVVFCAMFILGVLWVGGVSDASSVQAASGLNAGQVSAIIAMLEAFNVAPALLSSVSVELNADIHAVPSNSSNGGSNNASNSSNATAASASTVAPEPATPLTLSTDGSSPSAEIVSGGSLGVLAGAIDLADSGDPISLRQLGLQLTSGKAQDIKDITIWNGGTQVGTAYFSLGSLVTNAYFNPGVLVSTSSEAILSFQVNFNPIAPGGAINGDSVALGYDPTHWMNTSGTDLMTGNVTYAQGSAVFAPITVTNGSATTLTVINSSTTPSQTIVTGAPDQPLGGFAVSVSGEPVTVQSMTFHVDVNPALGNPISNIYLASSGGAVLAGPFNATPAVGGFETVNVYGQVALPVGLSWYVLEGDVPSGTPNNSSLFTVTSPLSDWGGITQAIGNSVSLSSASVAMNRMVLEGGSLNINHGAFSPNDLKGQTILSGKQQTLADFVLDTTQSGEAVTLPSIGLDLAGTAAPASLSRCAVWDNGSVLNSQNPLSPTAYGNQNFLFNSPLTVSAGTTTALDLTCNVATSTVGYYQWGIVAAPSVTGAVSGASISAAVPSTDTGPIMTVSPAGSLVNPQFPLF